jgi:ElaB/YqjD/DUF883 family membrane-anchored ribosome-binding protein
MDDNISKIKKTLENGLNQAGASLEDARQQFSDMAEDLKSNGTQVLNEAVERGSDLFEDIQEQGQGALKAAGRWIRNNPALAIGIAVLAGAAIFALSRSDEAEEASPAEN